MIISGKIEETREQIKKWKREGFSVGLVPTMGYLHEGHQSLMEAARRENDKVAVSVFVNPIQFGPNEDFASYPRDFEKDAALCERTGVDLIFHPEAEEMYDEDFCTYVDMDGLTKELCGKSRPTHFRGVQTVVSKLFHIIPADRAYFGEKDAQQLAVVRKMARDLSMDIQIVGCPIIREADGLAKSSRNTYLNAEERQAALVLSRSLTEGKRLIEQGERDAQKVKRTIQAVITQESLAKVDYVEIVDFADITPLRNLEAARQGEVLCAIAVLIGKTRLIDNFIVKVDKAKKE
ncbi:MAG: pantoate--beta-alanine ligase [Lachnospiraceae bacterium]